MRVHLPYTYKLGLLKISLLQLPGAENPRLASDSRKQSQTGPSLGLLRVCLTQTLSSNWILCQSWEAGVVHFAVRKPGKVSHFSQVTLWVSGKANMPLRGHNNVLIKILFFNRKVKLDLCLNLQPILQLSWGRTTSKLLKPFFGLIGQEQNSFQECSNAKLLISSKD